MKKTITLLLIISIFISSCGTKSKKDLTDNYDKNSLEIIKLRDYFNKIVPKNYLVRIRYNSSDNIHLFVYEPTETKENLDTLFEQWNLNITDYEPKPHTEYEKEYGGKTNSLAIIKQKLNWTDKTFSDLYDKLEKVNCMGICNRNPTEIEFGYKGMGVFSYLIFDDNLSTELQEKYSDDCTQMFYKDNVVLSYGSGATGSLCTPEFKRSK